MSLHLLPEITFSLASNRDKNGSKNGRYPIELILDNVFIGPNPHKTSNRVHR